MSGPALSLLAVIVGGGLVLGALLTAVFGERRRGLAQYVALLSVSGVALLVVGATAYPSAPAVEPRQAAGPVTAALTEPGDYDATLDRVVDGDTYVLDLTRRVDLGPGVSDAVLTVEVPDRRVRLLGVDTPERREPGFAEASAFALDALDDGPVLVTVTGSDSFGRLLADVTLSDGRMLAAALLDAGHAVPYQGR